MVSGVGGGVFMLSAVICLGKEMIRIGMTGIHPGDVVHFRAIDWHPSDYHQIQSQIGLEPLPPPGWA